MSQDRHRASFDVLRREASGFDRAVHGYDEEAIVQRALAGDLCRTLVPHVLGLERKVVWELGFGTGLLTERLVDALAPLDGWEGVDSSAASVELHRAKFAGCEVSMTRLFADAESTSPSERVNIVVGGSVVQWFTDFEGFLGRIGARGRLLAFSSFGPRNLRELRSSFRRASGRAFPSPVRYYDEEELGGLLERTGWTILEQRSSDRILQFRDLRALLRHLRRTGVVPRAGAPVFGPKLWKRWEEESDRYRGPEGWLPCTWDTQVWVCQSLGSAA